MVRQLVGPPVVAVIHPYGLPRYTRPVREVIGLNLYARDIAASLIALAPVLRAVIWAGGDEAGQECLSLEALVSSYLPDTFFLVEKCFHKREITILYEDRGLTTPAIIVNSEELMASLKLDQTMLVVAHFCDEPRQWKVKKLSNRLMSKQYHRIETLGFRRMDTTLKSTKVYQFLETLLLLGWPSLLRKRVAMSIPPTYHE